MSIGSATGVRSVESPSVDDRRPDGGLLDDARALLQQVIGLVHDQLQMAVLETKLAGQSLVAMVAAGVMVALLLVSAWLGLIAAAIAALIGNGLSISAAIFLGVSANLVLTLLLCAFIRRKSRHLLWSASLRSLKPAATAQNHARDST